MIEKFRTDLLIVFLVGTIILIAQACTIKPPDDGTDLGAETTGSAVNHAKSDAQAGYTFEKAFKVNDAGTVQIIDHVFGNSGVRFTYDYLVTSITPTGVFFTETTRETGSVGKGEITPNSWANSQSAVFKKSLQFFAALPDPLADFFTGTVISLSRLWSSVKVETSQALGQGASEFDPETDRSSARFNPLLPKLQENIAALLGTGLSNTGVNTKTSANPGPNSSPSPSPSSSPPQDPHAGEPCQDPSTSRCYGLHVMNHDLVTTNCSQILDCKVKATQIDFNEMRKVTRTSNAGTQTTEDVRFHWSIQISTQVPGLFVFMDQCFSTLITQNGQQIPLTECATVTKFSFGSGN